MFAKFFLLNYLLKHKIINLIFLTLQPQEIQEIGQAHKRIMLQICNFK